MGLKWPRGNEDGTIFLTYSVTICSFVSGGFRVNSIPKAFIAMRILLRARLSTNTLCRGEWPRIHVINDEHYYDFIVFREKSSCVFIGETVIIYIRATRKYSNFVVFCLDRKLWISFTYFWMLFLVEKKNIVEVIFRL